MFGALFEDQATSALLSDEALVARMVDVEAALVRSLVVAGIAPPDAAASFSVRLASFEPDLEALAKCTMDHGVPVKELVRQLREHVGEDLGRWVHHGATSQDVTDTAFVLQLTEVLTGLRAGLDRTVLALGSLAREHRDTFMAARTRSQHAVPTTFGLKVATWLAPLLRHRDRLGALERRLLVVQLGGAAGTLASYGDRGLSVQKALATELGLSTPPIPWHSQRDNYAELGGWLSLVTGSLGKMARDVILLAQTEIGELSESSDAGRGGSSAMPGKRNPVRSEAIVAAARHGAALLGSLHQALLHEHERDGQAWQQEWLALTQMLMLTGSALASAAALAEGLQVHPSRMADNVEATRGKLLGEAAYLLLSEHLDADEARARVREAGESIDGGGHLIDRLESAAGEIEGWSRIRRETGYLGSAGALVDAVLALLDA